MKTLLLPLTLFLCAIASQSRLPTHSPHPITLPIAKDLAHQHYLLNLSVGTPPSTYSVLLDTGSTDFWLPLYNSSGCAPDACKPGTFNPADSETAVDIDIPFNVSYGLTPGSGWLGEYYNESVTLGDLVMYNQTMATANVPAPITPSTFWGILGLGSRYATSSFINPWSPIYRQLNSTYVPLWEHLFESGLVPSRLISIRLGPQSAKYGSITFGGSTHDSDLQPVPVVLSGPLFTGWAINLTGVSRKSPNTTQEEPLTAPDFTAQVILETGAPNMYLPTSLYTSISAPLSPVYRPNPEGNPTPYVSCNPTLAGTAFNFAFRKANSSTLEISVPLHELILPFGLPENLGEIRGDNGEELCYFGVIPTGGPVFLLGATFLRSVVAVFSGEGGEWTISMAQANFD